MTSKLSSSDVEPALLLAAIEWATAYEKSLNCRDQILKSTNINHAKRLTKKYESFVDAERTTRTRLFKLTKSFRLLSQLEKEEA